jgi:formate/nitrite transporter FocA (FNT family)
LLGGAAFLPDLILVVVAGVEGITRAGIASDLIPAILANIVGGGVLVGLV